MSPRRLQDNGFVMSIEHLQGDFGLE